MNPVHYQSDKHDWRTPWALIRAIEARYGRKFDLDACATDEASTKAPAWYDPETDGLKQPWEGQVWCNPPYGREQVRWLEKALAESCEKYCEGVVCLVPARTDTAVFHDVIVPHAEIVFLRGRVTFERDGRKAKSAPFPSMLAVFSRYSPLVMHTWDWKKQ